VLPFTAPADTAYGEIRAPARTDRQTDCGNDLLIAAQTMALG